MTSLIYCYLFYNVSLVIKKMILLVDVNYEKYKKTGKAMY